MSARAGRPWLSVAAFIVASCAHVEPEWRSTTDVTPAQYERDAADCRFKGQLSSFSEAVSGNAGSSSGSDLEQMCMSRKGYYRVEKKP